MVEGDEDGRGAGGDDGDEDDSGGASLKEGRGGNFVKRETDRPSAYELGFHEEDMVSSAFSFGFALGGSAAVSKHVRRLGVESALTGHLLSLHLLKFNHLNFQTPSQACISPEYLLIPTYNFSNAHPTTCHIVIPSLCLPENALRRSGSSSPSLSRSGTGLVACEVCISAAVCASFVAQSSLLSR